MPGMFGRGRFLLGLAIAVLLFAGPVNATRQDAPDEVLREVIDGMIDRLHEEREAIHDRPQRLFELVDEVLAVHVDFPLISQWVLGKHWRQADAGQRERFIRAFRTLLVRFYTSALLEDPSQIDDVLRRDNLITFNAPQVDNKGENAIVRAEVSLNKGKKAAVVFRMHWRKDTWRLLDLSVEGISLVTTYRSSFAHEIQRVGLDGLIKRLTERNEQLLNQFSKGEEVKTAAGA